MLKSSLGAIWHSCNVSASDVPRLHHPAAVLAWPGGSRRARRTALPRGAAAARRPARVGLEGRHRARPSPTCDGRATPPALVAAVLSQSKLRARARAKFGEFASRMLFTEAGLEQATRLQVAALHAGRFARAGIGHVADLGCGIGGDALAMAAIDLEVTAVERRRGHRGDRGLQPDAVPRCPRAARTRRGGAARRHRRRLARSRTPHHRWRHHDAARGCLRLHALARLRVRPGGSHAGRREARPRHRSRRDPRRRRGAVGLGRRRRRRARRVARRGRAPRHPPRGARDPRRCRRRAHRRRRQRGRSGRPARRLPLRTRRRRDPGAPDRRRSRARTAPGWLSARHRLPHRRHCVRVAVRPRLPRARAAPVRRAPAAPGARRARHRHARDQEARHRRRSGRAAHAHEAARRRVAPPSCSPARRGAT